MNYNLKKIILLVFVIIFSILITVKFSISFFKNEIISIIKSEKFDRFIINVIDEKLEKIANEEISDQRKDFYNKNLNKIFEKLEIK